MLSSSFLEDLSVEILKIYAEIDRQVVSFQKDTGLRCPPGCGQCCASEKVMITPLEFLPLAHHLFQRGEAKEWWPSLTEEQARICVFFQPDLSITDNGHCKVYPWRAATCRLYGFAVKRNKYGALEPISCPYIKKDFLNLIAELRIKNLKDVFYPSYDSFMFQISCLDPHMGTNPLPVNQAIAKALEKYAISCQLKHSNLSIPPQGISCLNTTNERTVQR